MTDLARAAARCRSFRISSSPVAAAAGAGGFREPSSPGAMRTLALLLGMGLMFGVTPSDLGASSEGLSCDAGAAVCGTGGSRSLLVGS
jgi:hypothetical protein